MLSPAARSLYARAAALSRWAKEDPRKGTAAARKAFGAKFLDEVDPEGNLRRTDPAEANRRAWAARSAHFAKLAAKSVAARARNQASLRSSIKHAGSSFAEARDDE
jgi:hypothetical protein